MEDLVLTQNQIMGAMEQLLVNFKKDETRAYMINYLPSESKEKGIIRPETPGHLTQPPSSDQRHAQGVDRTPQPSARSETSFQVPKTQGSPSRLEELLRKQSSNFKAFQRTIKSIDLEIISQKWEFEDAMTSVQTRWSVIDALHWEIDSELYEENEEYEEAYNSCEQRYLQIKKDINSKMWSESHREKSTPHIDIPTFSGSYHLWVSFKDLFLETIHRNRCLSNAQKMQFLKSKLKGEAEKLVQHLNISSDNYTACWELLDHRYSNPKLIFNSHMHIIMNLPMIPQQSASAIKRIHDTTNECLNAIKNLGVAIDTWDPMIVYILSQKLDQESHNDYIESLKNPRELPSLQEFLKFLEAKFTALESSKRKQDQSKPIQQHQQISSSNAFKKSYKFKSFISNQNPLLKSQNNKKNTSATVQNCPVCNKNHVVPNCDIFVGYRPEVQRQTIAKLSLCKNCLYNHYGRDCFSNKNCHKCHANHHTIVHEAFTSPMTSQNFAISDNFHKQSKSSAHVSLEDTQEILLATSLVTVQAADGTKIIMRALIDQGSQTSLITENAAQTLGIPRQHCKGVILGLGAQANTCKGIMNVTISSIYSDYSLNTGVFIMKHAVNNLPNQSFSKPNWSFIENIQLADPEFYRRRSIDLLLGADIYSSIIMGGIIKENDSLPVAQQTRLGWILCGNVKSYQCNVVMLDVENLHKFWSIEDINEKIDISDEDYQCTELYKSTTTRQPDGKYVVRLPLHPDAEEKLGLSKPKACAQFYQLEKKLQKEYTLSNKYREFINEYIDMGHMHLTTISNMKPAYYLPHHGVHRADSNTTSLRVVFNASEKTDTGLSLNDLMYRGPNLQQDILSLILKWRKYKYAFTADIEKMFRQIFVHKEDQRYQQIVWRENPNHHLKDYTLATVTYGTKAAPYLAMMTLKQLAIDERSRYPVAAKVLEEQFYMDDVLSGAFDITSAKQLQKDLIELLKSGGFNLRKWSANEIALLESVDKAESIPNTYDFKYQASTKALGLTWNAQQDKFNFMCKLTTQPDAKPTKRVLLGEISKIFDPLGWLAPAVVQLKLLFQSVWSIDLKWDDVIPEDMYTRWIRLRADIENIKDIEVPRWIGSEQNDTIELHGFCDASLAAYACVVYARIVRQNQVKITLLAAKTKLVPISKTSASKKSDISLPRLELSGALLLSKLMTKIKQSLSEYNVQIIAWCDSTAVLGWLQGDPSRWKPFVANRVKEITAIIQPECWFYIKSSENPADCASRGTFVENLIKHELWWKGPSWLPLYDHQAYQKQSIFKTDLESKKILSNVIIKNDNTQLNFISDFINKYSNFTRASRVLAWIMRAFSRDRQKKSFLSTDELRSSQLKIIRAAQSLEFEKEMNDLRTQDKVDQKSKLLCLNPFIDSEGLLRVGGRLKNSNISYNMKHPYIIPHNSHLTNLLIDFAHKSTFHGGARLTHSYLRNQYWIVGGNRAVKKRLRCCVLCKRHNPIKHTQLMGNLPEARSNPTRPFYHSGVDYTGYVDVKSSKGRGIKSTKGYVAVFICMVTKAVHLELVSDLTSSAFLAALRRLSARRGIPRHLYSDNGTNFVGASKILAKEFINHQSILSEDFYAELNQMKIEWHFNAPSWPSAGGLWEAAVKSLKYHLRRVLGDQKLTYEEFTTLLSQLEACLNSRPLTTLTEDPQDLDYLTPSHFLASGPVLTIVETERDERTRWQLTQKIFNDIWKRWRAEYLTQLSARSKWRTSQSNIELNDVVIIHDANLPPGKWSLGRVIELHPGTDDHVRVVSVKTKKGIIKRPIIKLSKLPTNNPESNKKTSISSTSTHKHQNLNSVLRINPISLITLLIFFLTSAVIASSEYNITKLNNNKHIFFDNVGDMRLIQDQWKLIAYYDMQPYWQGSKVLTSYITHLDKMCIHSENNNHCSIVLLQLRHGYKELEFYDRMLRNQKFDTPRRMRRGLVNGIGYIANTLFGVLDERFAEQYERDINLVKTNQNHLLHLWKNQTSVIEAENNLLQRIENTIEKQHKIFNQHLNDLDQVTNNVKKEIIKVETTSDFILTSIIANNILLNLKNIQDALLDTITNLKHFNIHLLTPSQLQNELSIIGGQLPKDLALPLDNLQTDLQNIYKILKLMESDYHRLWTFVASKELPMCYRPHIEDRNLTTDAGTQLKVVMAAYSRPGVVAIQTGKYPTTCVWPQEIVFFLRSKTENEIKFPT
ncbi:hypothetical protein K1T71_012434 [Dendrolimus kikuchii]|uniref:Uncharacterized protein n=1 Tax=Dendrolimus kikuchii TaxID=765133 RepID=A0ACC1CJD4_9NEOP|nr:hypothetical protein K1T71_012434 [Dendrolimus kikuchii]